MPTVTALLGELFAYNQYANQKLIQCFRDYQLTDEKALRLFSHVLNAHHTWIARIMQQPPQYGVWQMHPITDFDPIDTANHRNTEAVLDSFPDFNQVIAYQTSQGVPYENSLSDVLLHTVNHSTYHRGQIATIIRERGYDPPVTDYIFYQREKK